MNMAGRGVAFAVFVLFALPMLAPSAIGEWESDSWISNIIGPERLEHGDEFGCHGYEGVNTVDENWVIQACSDYVNGITSSSRWGERPISFGIEGESLDQNTSNSLISAGFEIVGDRLTGPSYDVVMMHRNGASLEKGASDKALLESIEEDTIVSIYWRARVDDLRIREDKDLISWLEQQDVWLTTWGEWHHHGISSNHANDSISLQGNEIAISLAELETWNVPGTVSIQFDSDVLGVTDSDGGTLAQISDSERNLTVGWRNIDGGILLTMARGTTVTVTLENSIESVKSSPMSTFNGLHHSVTIVGHHTTNLFQWSSDFQKSDLRFTWLLERPKSEAVGWELPFLAATVLIAVPVSVYFILRSDTSDRTS
jgi:hypothetical protein